MKAAPLILIGVGLSLGFRANVWNIGAEGQYTLGAIFAAGLALSYPDAPSIVLLPAMMALGILGGMAWAAIPAYLRTRWNANEILTSLMLTYVAQLLLIYLVTGPWRDPDGYGFPQTALFSSSATPPILLEGTRVHLGVAGGVPGGDRRLDRADPLGASGSSCACWGRRRARRASPASARKG